MSQENIEIVRRIYRAWGEGSPASSGLLADDIEWVNPKGAVEPGIRKGVSAFGGAVSSVDDAFEDARLDFERFLDAGDQVVVIATLRGTGRGSRIAVERRQGYVWTIREGKAIRFQWFPDPADALEAAGLSQ
jgi:uncharacterized protein